MTEQEAKLEIRRDIVSMFEAYITGRPNFDKYYSLFVYIKTLKECKLYVDYELNELELKAINKDVQEDPTINKFERMNIRRIGITKENELLKKHGGRAQDIKSLELTFKMIKENNVNLIKILGL